MKWLIILCLLHGCICRVNAQGYNDYATTDAKALQIPSSETYASSSIANYVQLNFKTDKEKVRAVYAWITTNIRYSKDSMYYHGWGTDPELKMASILRKRKGVCENYAELFTNIVLKCGIQAVVVSGYTNITGAVNPTAHSWCAVYVDKQWLLCDPTWDEGFKITTRYFFIAPAQFIETHFPYDPLWQLLGRPISHTDFRRGFVQPKKEASFFNYTDSVNTFLQLDTLQQLVAASRRMKQYGADNESLKTWLTYNDMKIAIVYQEDDMNNFNAAVANRNKVRVLFNDFIAYRNNKFKPERTEASIHAGFIAIDSLLADAYKKTTTIGSKTENFQYDTDGLKNSLDALAKKALEQQVFLKRYFASSMAEREQLFYR